MGEVWFGGFEVVGWILGVEWWGVVVWCGLGLDDEWELMGIELFVGLNCSFLFWLFNDEDISFIFVIEVVIRWFLNFIVCIEGGEFCSEVVYIIFVIDFFVDVVIY